MVWSQAEGLDWSYQRLVPKWHWTTYGRNKLWLVGCLGTEPRLSQSQNGGKRLMSGALVKPLRLGERSARRAPTLHRKPWNLPYNWGKITENPSQTSRKALGWSTPNTIRLVDLAIAGDDLDWPTDPCRPSLSHQATGSTLGQRKYLPSCRNMWFPTSANLESKLAVRALMWSAKGGTPRYLRTR
jgi:hypothetical protein